MTQNDTRTERITFLVSPAERQVIEDLSDQLRLTVSDTCLVALLELDSKVKAELEAACPPT